MICPSNTHLEPVSLIYISWFIYFADIQEADIGFYSFHMNMEEYSILMAERKKHLEIAVIVHVVLYLFSIAYYFIVMSSHHESEIYNELDNGESSTMANHS